MGTALINMPQYIEQFQDPQAATFVQHSIAQKFIEYVLRVHSAL